MDYLEQNRRDVFTDEGASPCQAFPRDTAQRPLVRTLVDVLDLTSGLLWRHVIRRSHDQRRSRELGRGRAHLADAEIEDLDEVLGTRDVQQVDVSGLEVAVDDPLGMSGSQGRRDLLDDVDHVGDRQASNPTQAVVQVFAFEKFHDKEGLAGRRGAEIEDLHDVRMAQSTRHPSFPAKAFESFLVCGQFARHHLDRNRLVEPELGRTVDGPHSSLAQ